MKILCMLLLAGCTIVEDYPDPKIEDAGESNEECLERCTALDTEACKQCDLFTCTGQRVECRTDCKETCSVSTLETLYYCIADAVSKEMQTQCFFEYCVEAGKCQELDRLAVQYYMKYCD